MSTVFTRSLRHHGRTVWMVVLVVGWSAGTASCAHPAGRGRATQPTAAFEPSPEPTAQLAVTAEAWPEADGLFHGDPRWLGGDAAFSVDLGDGRILWMFGDSFVEPDGTGDRGDATFVHNTVALQEGCDPTTAAMSFYWHSVEDHVASFFPDDDRGWRWPQHGILLDDTLTLFFQRVERTRPDDPFGFRAVGWEALRVDHPDGPPDSWSFRLLETSADPPGLIVGASVLSDGVYVYAFALEEPGRHDVYVARWTVGAFLEGDLTAPEWWLGSPRGWAPLPERRRRPRIVMRRAAPEFSVSWLPGFDRFVYIETHGFGAATLGVRFSRDLARSWSPLRLIYDPPESQREHALVYAGKAHPSLCGADLVATYASNAWDLGTLVRDDSLYFPRVVRIRLAQP